MNSIQVDLSYFSIAKTKEQKNCFDAAIMSVKRLAKKWDFIFENFDLTDEEWEEFNMSLEIINKCLTEIGKRIWNYYFDILSHKKKTSYKERFINPTSQIEFDLRNLVEIKDLYTLTVKDIAGDRSIEMGYRYAYAAGYMKLKFGKNNSKILFVKPYKNINTTSTIVIPYIFFEKTVSKIERQNYLDKFTYCQEAKNEIDELYSAGMIDD